jgi:hypothetical protein
MHKVLLLHLREDGAGALRVSTAMFQHGEVESQLKRCFVISDRRIRPPLRRRTDDRISNRVLVAGGYVPSGIQHPDVVDLVFFDPATDAFVLIMIEDRDWSTGAGHADQLLRKINAYLHFVLDGDLVAQFPDALGKAVRFQLDCGTTPIGECADLIQQAQALLLARGMRLDVNVICDQSHQST